MKDPAMLFQAVQTACSLAGLWLAYLAIRKSGAAVDACEARDKNLILETERSANAGRAALREAA